MSRIKTPRAAPSQGGISYNNHRNYQGGARSRTFCPVDLVLDSHFQQLLRVYCVPRLQERQGSPTPNQRALRRESAGERYCCTQPSPSAPDAGSRSGRKRGVTIWYGRFADYAGSEGLETPRVSPRAILMGPGSSRNRIK